MKSSNYFEPLIIYFISVSTCPSQILKLGRCYCYCCSCCLWLAVFVDDGNVYGRCCCCCSCYCYRRWCWLIEMHLFNMLFDMLRADWLPVGCSVVSWLKLPLPLPLWQPPKQKWSSIRGKYWQWQCVCECGHCGCKFVALLAIVCVEMELRMEVLPHITYTPPWSFGALYVWVWV